MEEGTREVNQRDSHVRLYPQTTIKSRGQGCLLDLQHGQVEVDTVNRDGVG